MAAFHYTEQISIEDDMMEILNNFASIPCFITFVLGAVFMLAMIIIAAMGKVEEPTNKVRFYVTKDFLGGNTLHLWLGKPIKYEEKWTATLKSAQCIGSELCLFRFNLNPEDFADMKEGEIREVFLNLED